MALSHSPLLRIVSAFFATFVLYYAYTYLFDPYATIPIFEFDRAPTASERYYFDTLLGLLGSKALFVSFALYAAALVASPRLLGSLLLAVGGIAYVDGLVLKRYVGHGEWNHWGYGIVVAGFGLVLLGVLDRR